MYIELNKKIALSTEEAINHSRPSIDLSFVTAAQTYHRNLVGIILSGANKDGAWGLKKIRDEGGTTIVQDPDECEVATMSRAAIDATEVNHIYSTNQIIDFLVKIK
jgi:two-component system chemotaxis response regulator CheB